MNIEIGDINPRYWEDSPQKWSFSVRVEKVLNTDDEGYHEKIKISAEMTTKITKLKIAWFR